MISIADHAGGFGEKPKPTVKVWMGEGSRTGCITQLSDSGYLGFEPAYAAWI
jgi:hypothetical protein